jgi:hypothetical protein
MDGPFLTVSFSMGMSVCFQILKIIPLYQIAVLG